jgi:urease accessory protein
MTPSLLPLLVLADGRLPAGGHVHSGGIEQAIADGVVGDIGSLTSYLEARTVTVGAVEACFTAGAQLEVVGAQHRGWTVLIDEFDARLPVPALRDAARTRGRHLVRVAEQLLDGGQLPAVLTGAGGAPVPLVLGALAGALGQSTAAAALLALHASVAEPAQAAVRLLGLDPLAVTAIITRLQPVIGEQVDRATLIVARDDPEHWPAWSTPRWDLAAAAHAARDDRYFDT